MAVFSLNQPLSRFSLYVVMSLEKITLYFKLCCVYFFKVLSLSFTKVLIFRSSQTILLCIVGELARGDSVAVACCGSDM